MRAREVSRRASSRFLGGEPGALAGGDGEGAWGSNGENDFPRMLQRFLWLGGDESAVNFGTTDSEETTAGEGV